MNVISLALAQDDEMLSLSMCTLHNERPPVSRDEVSQILWAYRDVSLDVTGNYGDLRTSQASCIQIPGALSDIQVPTEYLLLPCLCSPCAVSC